MQNRMFAKIVWKTLFVLHILCSSNEIKRKYWWDLCLQICWIYIDSKMNRKVINNPSDWFWQNLNSLSFLLSFSCDLNQSIPPFHPKCNVHCSEYWKIESVLNSIHTQNIDSFVLLSLLDLFIGKDNFQYWWVETSIYFSFFNEKGVILEKRNIVTQSMEMYKRFWNKKQLWKNCSYKNGLVDLSLSLQKG